MTGFSLFNIGFSELFVVLLLAGFVMGPYRIRTIARWMGKSVGSLRVTISKLMSQLHNELDGEEQAELRGMLNDMRELQQELLELRRELVAGPKRESDALSQDIKRVQAAISADIGSISPNGSNGKNESSSAPPTTTLPNALHIDDDPE